MSIYRPNNFSNFCEKRLTAIMKIYKKVVFSKDVLGDIAALGNFISSQNTQEAANKYIDALEAEISALIFLADVIQKSQLQTILRYHPDAKRMITRNRKWNVIFHTKGDKVFVDKLIPCKMIKD